MGFLTTEPRNVTSYRCWITYWNPHCKTTSRKVLQKIHTDSDYTFSYSNDNLKIKKTK